MENGSFVRAVIANFLSAFIISAVACYFLLTYGLTEVIYIGNLFGLYFLVVFGTEILIESGKLQNNIQRFKFVIVNIIVFDILFLIVMPLLFGAHIFDPADNIFMVFGGFQYNLVLGVYFYMVVFAILMLVFNYLFYRIETR